MTNPSRRNFLFGRFSRQKSPQRPPWALVENRFLDACTRCSDCVKVCPTHIISDREDGYPVVDFAEGECTFCGECARVCKSGALVGGEERTPWTIRAVIGDLCLAHQGIECRVCGEQCGENAIRFPLQAGRISVPEIDASRCTGCGACFNTCPSRTISLG